MILDLEDSVAADEKASVRNLYVQALDDGVLSGMRIFVRVSDLGARDEVEEDIRALTRPDVLGFVLPKVKCADQIMLVDELLTKLENERNREMAATNLIPFAAKSLRYRRKR